MTLSDPILRSFCIFDQFLCLFHEFLSNFRFYMNFHQNCPKYANFGDFPEFPENAHFWTKFIESRSKWVEKM